jgi:hypothetical protein
MISIIIASADPDQLRQVSENIEITIGVPFEIIAINNSDGSKGICEIYNSGIQQARYNMLCFMHEDILIKTYDWGNRVLNFFTTHHDYGLLGIGGSEYKSLAPSGWNPTGIETAYINLIQRFKYKQQEPFHYYKNPGKKEFAEVACIDGVWFCTPKAIASEVTFDEITFKGFHAYDLDFSLSIGQNYKIGVTFDILIDHFSEGSYNAEWIAATLDLHKKWNSRLPVNLKPASKKQMLYAEKATFKFFIDQLILLKFPRRVAFEMLYYNNSFLKLSPKLFFKLHFIILKKYTKA